jgi:polyisoprenyl-phosphate glycosyltransferase
MIGVIAPCFNEETTIVKFLLSLEIVLSRIDNEFRVVVVDDCSQDASLELLSTFKFGASNIGFDVIHLNFNIGHQGAIYQGMLHAASFNPDNVVIMDSDGEDDPAAIPLMLQCKQYEIVEVKRGKRSESTSFKLAYFFYKLIFRFITGRTIDYGNYCLVSSKILDRIRHTSFVHLPAYLLKQKASRTSIRFNRSKRIDGESKMGYKGLLLHGFKSMIEFAEDLLMLFFRMFIFILLIFTVVLINILYQKFVSQTAIAGWFSTLSISLVILAVLCIGFFIIGIILLNLLHQQNIKSFKGIYSVVKQDGNESTH